jgi:hypothetical protein
MSIAATSPRSVHKVSVRAVVDPSHLPADDRVVAEYALVSSMVAILAIALASIPESQLAARLPVTNDRATALVIHSAREARVSASQARAALRRAPYARAPLRYLYAAGWITGRQTPYECVFAKATPEATRKELTSALRKDARLLSRLRRMSVTVAQAADALAKGTASAC